MHEYSRGLKSPLDSTTRRDDGPWPGKRSLTDQLAQTSPEPSVQRKESKVTQAPGGPDAGPE